METVEVVSSLTTTRNSILGVDFCVQSKPQAWYWKRSPYSQQPHDFILWSVVSMKEYGFLLYFGGFSLGRNSIGAALCYLLGAFMALALYLRRQYSSCQQVAL